MNQRDNALPPHCNALPTHCNALPGYQNALSKCRDELPMRQFALPLFSNAMHVHRLFCVVALVVTVSFSGCALTHETGRVFRLAKRTVQIEPRFYEYIKSDRVAQREARLLAEQAWGEIAHAVPNASPDYENGFTEGFADYLYRGGSGEPPLVPPRGYWSLRFLNPQGKMVVEEWFAGFRHGAENCKARGIRDMWVVPTSFVPEPDPPSARPPIDSDSEMKFMNPGPEMDFQQAEPNAEPAPELESDESDASPTSETLPADEAMDDELDANAAETPVDAPISGDGDTSSEASLLDFGGAPEVAPEETPELPPNNGDLKFFDEVDPPPTPEQNEPTNNPFRDEEADPFMIPGGDAPEEPTIDFGDFGPINLPEGTTVPANLEPVPRSHGRHPATYIKQTSAQVERKPASRPNKLRPRGNTYRNTYRDVVASASGSRSADSSASGRPRELPMKLVATPIRKPTNNRATQTKAGSPVKSRVEPAMKLEAAPSPASPAPRSNSLVEPFDDSLPSIPLQIDAPRMSLDDLDWNPMKDIAALPSAPGANDWRSAEPTGDASTDAIRWNAEFSRSNELPLQLADRTREMPRVIVGEAMDGRAPMKTDSGVDRGRVDVANGSVDSFLNFESTGRSIRDDLQLMLREANSGTPAPRRVAPPASAINEAFESAALKWRNEK